MPEEFSRTYSWQDPAAPIKQGMEMSGLEYMQALVQGKFPQVPMAQTLNFALTEVEAGYACFECEPQAYHYNPIGVVHGGLASILLDSALGCAIHSTLPAGTGYTTVQLNVNLVRAVTTSVRKLYTKANVIHAGRQVATAEGTVTDDDGKVYARGTTTCLVFLLPD